MIASSVLAGHAEALRRAFERGWHRVTGHGDYPRWSQALWTLPDPTGAKVTLDRNRVTVDAALDARDTEVLEQSLRALMPWRKGPFSIAGVEIDCEWRSDWKWQRLADAITPLEGRTVLDVGCGSGYHCWRMRGAGAALVVGIDPTPLFAMQFQAVNHYIGDARVQMWPLAVEEFPPDMGCFDTVFSMGLLYHRRDPLGHLAQLQALLRPDGELVLESLVVEGDAQRCLVPSGRYARMRNVWFIPSVEMLLIWLRRCGWRNARLVDCTATTVLEQRATPWMRFESLAECLDPDDATRTIEGYPAPLRAIVVARR